MSSLHFDLIVDVATTTLLSFWGLEDFDFSNIFRKSSAQVYPERIFSSTAFRCQQPTTVAIETLFRFRGLNV